MKQIKLNTRKDQRPISYKFGLAGLLIIYFAVFGGKTKIITKGTVKAQDIATESAQVVVVETPLPTPIAEVKQTFSYEDFKHYVRVIFGNKANTALAVSAVECNHNRTDWPQCVKSTEKEHSIGVFQINIAKDQGRGAWVHWARIPGETLEEKEEWLKDPYNNTLMAKVIEERSDGFTPWSGYTSGQYENHL